MLYTVTSSLLPRDDLRREACSAGGAAVAAYCLWMAAAGGDVCSAAERGLWLVPALWLAVPLLHSVVVGAAAASAVLPPLLDSPESPASRALAAAALRLRGTANLRTGAAGVVARLCRAASSAKDERASRDALRRLTTEGGADVAWVSALEPRPRLVAVVLASLTQLVTAAAKKKGKGKKGGTTTEEAASALHRDAAAAVRLCRKWSNALGADGAEACRRACVLVGALADTGGIPAQRALVDEGAVEALVAAMELHPSSEPVQQWTLWALFQLAFDDAANKVYVERALLLLLLLLPLRPRCAAASVPATPARNCRYYCHHYCRPLTNEPTWRLSGTWCGPRWSSRPSRP